MDKLELQKLRDLPIEGVAERLGLSVSRHKSLCPFHEDRHPSLSFNIRKNTYRCFVCGASGGTIDLVMKYLRKDFLAASQWLADENNIILTEYKAPPLEGEVGRGLFAPKKYERFFERPWLSEAAKRFLFDERRLDPRVVRWCRLTSWQDRQGINWLQIPYYDQDYHLIGIQNRNLDYHKASLNILSAGCSSPRGGGREGALERASRFRFPTGSRCTIYNLPVLNMLREGEPLYITEGSSDCWAMLSAGHKAIAIPSATLLKPSDMKLLSTINSKLSTPFHMYPDNDLPGERLFLQLKELLPNLVHHQLPEGCKDFGEYYSPQKPERGV